MDETRQFCLEMARRNAVEGTDGDVIVRDARAFYAFMSGNDTDPPASAPDRDDEIPF